MSALQDVLQEQREEAADQVRALMEADGRLAEVEEAKVHVEGQLEEALMRVEEVERELSAVQERLAEMSDGHKVALQHAVNRADELGIPLIVTGLSIRFSVQAASHGAGHTRPVNSGKLLVECSTSSAFFQSSS